MPILETSGLLAQSLVAATSLTLGVLLGGIWWLYRRRPVAYLAAAWVAHGLGSVAAAGFIATHSTSPASPADRATGAMMLACLLAASALFLAGTAGVVGRRSVTPTTWRVGGVLILAISALALVVPTEAMQPLVRAGSRGTVMLALGTCLWWLRSSGPFPGRGAHSAAFGLLTLRSVAGFFGPLAVPVAARLGAQPLWFTLLQLVATLAAGFLTGVALLTQERLDAVAAATLAGQAQRELLQARAVAREREVAAAREVQLLVDSIHDFVVTLSADLRIASASPRARHFLGVAAEEVVGRELPSFVRDAEREGLRTYFRNAALPGHDGELIAVGLESGRTVELTARLVATLGGSTYFAVLRDVTERTALEQRLAHVQRLESLGKMAGSVAHDFRNVLAAIFGFGGLLKEHTRLDPALHADVDGLLDAANRGNALTKQLLLFARQQEVQPTTFNAIERIQGLLPMLRHISGTGIDVKFSATVARVEVVADPTQFDQLLVNLASNGRDAMAGRGVLQVSVARIALGAEEGLSLTLPVGDYCVVTVADHGHGIDPAVLSRVFEPFFTTKATGEGTGLGLASAYGFVRQAGGTIEVESEVGRGATFKVLLPASPLPSRVPTGA